METLNTILDKGVFQNQTRKTLNSFHDADCKKIKKELTEFFTIRSVRKGTGSMSGLIEICVDVYDSTQLADKRAFVHNYMKTNYPELLTNVY